MPHLRGNGFGRVINFPGHTAREAGSIGAGARNAAVVNLTKALSMEFSRDGIAVNAIDPFTTVTKGFQSRLKKMAERRGRTPDEHPERISARTSVGRLVTAAEIAYFVAFLASPCPWP